METKGAILVVDDSPLSREIMFDALTAEGYLVRQANSGELALASVAASPPDLILLDLSMPGMDGFEVLRQLKSSEKNSHIPVILVSASTDLNKQVGGIRRGAVDFILKPFQKVELLMRVRTHLELNRLHLSLDQRALELQRANESLEFEIAQREQIERAQFKLLDIVDKSLNEIYVFDAGTLKFQYLNQGALQNLGYAIEDMPFLTPLDIKAEFSEAEFRRLINPLLTGEKERLVFETSHRRKDGSVYPVEIHLQLNRQENETVIFAIINDISERRQADESRRKLEQQMLNTQKLESLGVLAGGIAHDFNNILMAIMGNASLALMRLSPDSPVADNLRQIEQAADRAAHLAQQMLAYSGKGKFVVEPIDLSHLVAEMTQMLEVAISKKTILRYNFGNGLPLVEADATQLRQIIMNLVINASEANGDRSGIIAITTGAVDCDRAYLSSGWLSEQLAEGLYVFLEVADSGCGMDKETISRLFDPFFTTKFTGRGLGMAAVHGIVRGHKGAIKVYSEPGKGTTLKVLLPAAARPAATSPAGQSGKGWQGHGKVLLVDDEETVRAVTRQMLQLLGFEVLLAADGLEALALFQANPEISHIILDLTMPHLGGEDAFRELRKLDSQVKIIMSSGYNEQEVSQKFAGKGLTGFIQKPYTMAALREVLKNVNDRTGSGV